MTETEWLASSDPDGMLKAVVSREHRKCRLFAVACCRRLWALLTPLGQNALDLAERFADGNATRDELISIRSRNSSATSSGEYGNSLDVYLAIRYAVALWEDPNDCQYAHPRAAVATNDVPAEWKAQADLLRCIFGNPFRPIPLDPGWLTSTAVAIARQMYESRDFSAMPILADALQDAGCDNDDILTHSRGPGPHVRGCWAVDLLLGKS